MPTLVQNDLANVGNSKADSLMAQNVPPRVRKGGNFISLQLWNVFKTPVTIGWPKYFTRPGSTHCPKQPGGCFTMPKPFPPSHHSKVMIICHTAPPSATQFIGPQKWHRPLSCGTQTHHPAFTKQYDLRITTSPWSQTSWWHRKEFQTTTTPIPPKCPPPPHQASDTHGIKWLGFSINWEKRSLIKASIAVSFHSTTQPQKIPLPELTRVSFVEETVLTQTSQKIRPLQIPVPTLPTTYHVPL